MTKVSEASLNRALTKALKTLDKESLCSASAVDAGFVFPPGQKKGQRKGFQVFVKVCRYSDELLASNPESGGLG